MGAGFTSPSQQWCTRSWSFRTMCGGIDPEDGRFRPRFVGVIHLWEF